MGNERLKDMIFEYNSDYVHIKLNTFEIDNEEKQMIQIIDISGSILYDQKQAENEFISLVNACVSHELRNPLNSI